MCGRAASRCDESSQRDNKEVGFLTSVVRSTAKSGSSGSKYIYMNMILYIVYIYIYIYELQHNQSKEFQRFCGVMFGATRNPMLRCGAATRGKAVDSCRHGTAVAGARLHLRARRSTW